MVTQAPSECLRCIHVAASQIACCVVPRKRTTARPSRGACRPLARNMGSCVVSLSRVFRARNRSRVEYIPRERGCGLWLVPALLRQIIRELQRPRFGRRAESLPEDQLLLGLEELRAGGGGSPRPRGAADSTKRNDDEQKQESHSHASRGCVLVVAIAVECCPHQRAGELMAENTSKTPGPFDPKAPACRPAAQRRGSHQRWQDRRRGHAHLRRPPGQPDAGRDAQFLGEVQTRGSATATATPTDQLARMRAAFDRVLAQVQELSQVLLEGPKSTPWRC